MYPSAPNAKDVVMRLHVAVIASKIVQKRHLVRFAHFAKLFQNTMDCSQRYVGMAAANYRTDLIGARMVIGGEQGTYDGKPLGCDGNPALMTPRDEFAETLNCVPLTPPSIHEPDFSHKPLLAYYQQ
jgi:hypothetical protein